MRKNNCKYTVGGALVVLIAGWLFLGIYHGREFTDKHLFLKHRPTFKFNFYSPLGESDGTLKTLNALNPKLGYEEMKYQEYVEIGGGNIRSIPLEMVGVSFIGY
jgi:hypothetical protein